MRTADDDDDDNGIPSINDILRSIDDVQNEAIDFLQRIVAINSTLEVGEGNVQNVIYDHIQHVLGGGSSGGFDVTKHPVRLDDIRHMRGYSPVDWKYDDNQKFNVVARSCCRPQNNNSTNNNDNDAVFLCGHVDVVPAPYSDGWTKDPYDAYIKNGRMYGRGSGDMKAGVVAMIYALVAVQRLGYMPGKGGVTICTVVEEECTGNGALASIIDNSGGGDDGCFCCPSDRRTSIVPLDIINTSVNVDAAATKKMGKGGRTAVIIPEPFPWIVTAQMGVLWFRATVTGKPCHVLSTSSGSNAIEGAYALYDALRTIEDRYNEPRGCAHPAFVGIDHPVNFNLGKIVGGNWASSVPSNCTFEVRVGFFPGVKIDDVKQDVETSLNTKAKELGLGLEITYQGFHADGAVLLPEYVNGRAQNVVDSGDSSSSSSLQREFVETLRKCNGHATKESSSSSPLKELHLKPVTCTTDARFYSSLFQDPSKVVVTCYGPEATNIHGVDESVCLESFRDVTATMALFIRDWCGLVKG